MTDITKCVNETCPMKDSCWRYIAPASEHQSYAEFKWKDGKCEHYWKRENNELNTTHDHT